MKSVRSQLSALHHQLSFLLVLSVFVAPIGCSGPQLVLEFPDGRHFTKSAVVKNGVNFVLELEDEPADELLRPTVSQHGAATHFDFGDSHKIQFRYQLFHVGEARYPAAQSTLFVLLPRTGPWNFRYRGHDVTIERQGRWKPSVYFKQVEESVGDEGNTQEYSVPHFPRRRRQSVALSISAGQKQIDREEVRVLTNKIVFRPARGGSPGDPSRSLDSGSWEINGHNVPVTPGSEIVIREDGTIRQNR